MIIIQHKEKGGILFRQIIFDEDTVNIKSPAASALLHEDLLNQDFDFINKDFRVWLQFRNDYLHGVLAEKGDLVCCYCGKKHLDIGLVATTRENGKENNRNPNLATVDHIIPTSKGGNKFDKNNLCVACRKCNEDKSNKSVEEYMIEVLEKKPTVKKSNNSKHKKKRNKWFAIKRKAKKLGKESLIYA